MIIIIVRIELMNIMIIYMKENLEKKFMIFFMLIMQNYSAQQQKEIY